MHDLTDKTHWHEPTGEKRAGFGKFGRPVTPYDAFNGHGSHFAGFSGGYNHALSSRLVTIVVKHPG